MCLFHGDIKQSLKYNILTIPLIIFYLVYCIWYFIDYFNHKDSLNKFILRYKHIIIFVAIILMIISEVRNLMNPLLYD